LEGLVFLLQHPLVDVFEAVKICELVSYFVLFLFFQILLPLDIFLDLLSVLLVVQKKSGVNFAKGFLHLGIVSYIEVQHEFAKFRLILDILEEQIDFTTKIEESLGKKHF